VRAALASLLCLAGVASAEPPPPLELQRVAGGLLVVERDGNHILSERLLPLSGNVVDAIAVGPTLYLARGDLGLTVVDVSNPARPLLVRTILAAGNVTRIEAREGRLEVLRDDYTVRAYDLTDPLDPKPLPTEELQVTGVRQGMITVKGAHAPRAGDRVVIRSAEGVKGVAEVERVEGGEGVARLPRGLQADAGDAAELTWARPEPSLAKARMWRGITRVDAVLRPAIGLDHLGFVAQAQLAVDHWFRGPFRIGVALSPVAFATENGGAAGASGLLMARGGLSFDYIGLAVAFGADLHQRAGSGFAFGGELRFGGLDGFHLILAANGVADGNGKLDVGSFTGEIDVPVSRRFNLTANAGAARGWSYGTVGLKSYLRGTGGPGTIVLATAVGFAGLHEADVWQYGVATLGPALSVGVDSRY
jgi:LVIVD repeat